MGDEYVYIESPETSDSVYSLVGKLIIKERCKFRNINFVKFPMFNNKQGVVTQLSFDCKIGTLAKYKHEELVKSKIEYGD